MTSPTQTMPATPAVIDPCSTWARRAPHRLRARAARIGAWTASLAVVAVTVHCILPAFLLA